MMEERAVNDLREEAAFQRCLAKEFDEELPRVIELKMHKVFLAGVLFGLDMGKKIALETLCQK